jgi:GTP:adenosylcobinamide-phosphate guanylyltransferase
MLLLASGIFHTDIQQQRKKQVVKKEQSHSCIEVNCEVHSFVAADQDYPKIADFNAEWMRLCGKMKESGYVVDMNFVLHEVEEGEVSHFY